MGHTVGDWCYECVYCRQRAEIVILEDNDAVIKMTVKGRSPAMRHVNRTHRVNIDWIFERVREDPAIRIRYVNTKQQAADLLTKGSFIAQTWMNLCSLAQVGTPGKQKVLKNAGGDSPAQQGKAKNTKKEKQKCEEK